MTFREALEQEISTQGISVAEVAAKSQVSKGAIYNILNGTTEDSRIRVGTRRALARGCERELQTLPDGGVVFVAPTEVVNKPVEANRPLEDVTDLSVQFLSFRPFFSQNHVSDAFDWLYKQEEDGKLVGLQIVDRVFQRREDFLSVIVENQGSGPIGNIAFEMQVDYALGVSGLIACQMGGLVAPGQKVEYTLFVLAGPAYKLSLVNGRFDDAQGQVKGIVSAPVFQFEGDLS